MTPYSAAPLTADQRTEVLRVMSESVTNEQHNYRAHLVAERAALFQQARQQPERRAELHATAAGFERALELLDACWPTTALADQIKAAA